MQQQQQRRRRHHHHRFGRRYLSEQEHLRRQQQDQQSPRLSDAHAQTERNDNGLVETVNALRFGNDGSSSSSDGRRVQLRQLSKTAMLLQKAAVNSKLRASRLVLNAAGEETEETVEEVELNLSSEDDDDEGNKNKDVKQTKETEVQTTLDKTGLALPKEMREPCPVAGCPLNPETKVRVVGT